MTNFVLTGLPDFVIIGVPRQPSLPHAGGEPVHVDSRFAEILALLGSSVAEVELADRVTYNESADRALRKVLEQFGFERRPDTFAELYGLLDYCDRLAALSGIGVVHEREIRAWRARSLLLLSRRQATLRTAVELFCRSDLVALRAWHRDSDTLFALGQAYRRLP